MCPSIGYFIPFLEGLNRLRGDGQTRKIGASAGTNYTMDFVLIASFEAKQNTANSVPIVLRNAVSYRRFVCIWYWLSVFYDQRRVNYPKNANFTISTFIDSLETKVVAHPWNFAKMCNADGMQCVKRPMQYVSYT